MPRSCFAGALCLLSAAGCSTRLVPLQPQNAVALARDTALFRVVATVDHAADPLPLQGEGVAFAGVADTLGDAIAAAAVPWAQRHQAQRPGGWEMRVDLLQSRADVNGGRITVELATRVTLTATVGRVYLAQTHGYCRQTDVLQSNPTQTVYACMDAMARDLAGWLEGVQP